jgi:predicted hydrolase (HD superfamily)
LTGLIVATALIYPTKKLSEVKLSSILKRFHKEPRFAAGTRRDEVALCQNKNGLNLPLDTFVDICLKSMQSIAQTLGL